MDNGQLWMRRWRRALIASNFLWLQIGVFCVQRFERNLALV
jgi:hypothetical protein